MTLIEIFLVIAALLGGLALFLTGMDSMSDSLTGMAGGTLSRAIGSITKNRLFAFLFGMILTALVQSSSAITVLSVGLVNSGIIALKEAVGLIIGANLGTTATSWLLSLNAVSGESFLLTLIKPSSFSPFLAIAGVAIRMVSHSEKKRQIGSVLLGFAIMMIGMNLMSQGVAPLREIPAIQNTLISLSNPILGFLFACAFSMLIQSSDAVIGILQAFALSMGITFGTAIPLICGAQVGTCITALLSSLGASNNGKRTALVNLYYNLLKTIPFLIIFYTLNRFFAFSFLEKNVGGIGIPVFHTLVNLLGSILWLPLSGMIVAMAKKTIPFSEREIQEQANTLTILDKNLLRSPEIAIEQADKAVDLLASTVGEVFLAVIGMRQDPELSGQVNLLSERTRRYYVQIEDYLLQISERDLNKGEKAHIKLLTSANTAFERMGRTAEKVLQMMEVIPVSSDNITPEDRTEMRVLGESIYEIMQLTINGFVSRSVKVPQTVQYYREEIMELSEIIKKRYIRRVHEEGIERISNTLYTDICNTEEQLIDYCDMIAEALIRYDQERGKHREEKTVSKDWTRQQVHELFRDKYEALGVETGDHI